MSICASLHLSLKIIRGVVQLVPARALPLYASTCRSGRAFAAPRCSHEASPLFCRHLPFHGSLLVYRRLSSICRKSLQMWSLSPFPTPEVRACFRCHISLLVNDSRLAMVRIDHSSTFSTITPSLTFSISLVRRF